MFDRCPSLFIQASMTAAASSWPWAMFSARALTPARSARWNGSSLSGLTWSKKSRSRMSLLCARATAASPPSAASGPQPASARWLFTSARTCPSAPPDCAAAAASGAGAGAGSGAGAGAGSSSAGAGASSGAGAGGGSLALSGSAVPASAGVVLPGVDSAADSAGEGAVVLGAGVDDSAGRPSTPGTTGEASSSAVRDAEVEE
jgi:hypothetical protein